MRKIKLRAEGLPAIIDELVDYLGGENKLGKFKVISISKNYRSQDSVSVRRYIELYLDDERYDE